MEAKAILRGARISAQKARLVADQVRGLGVGQATNLLQFSDKKAAHLIKKVLLSAVANAENNLGADVDELKVATVEEAPKLKPPPPFSMSSSAASSLPSCLSAAAMVSRNFEEPPSSTNWLNPSST